MISKLSNKCKPVSNCCIISRVVSQSVGVVPPSTVSKVAMAVAAMVARQMRENQERKDGPNYKWTEKERNLYELQQKSRSKLKVTDTAMRIFQDNPEFLFSVRFSAGYSGEKQASTPWSSQVLQSAPPFLPSGSAPGTTPGLS